MKYLKEWKVFEAKREQVELEFKPEPKKKGAKTGTWNVVKGSEVVGQIKWSSRMRGYAFLPTSDCNDEIKEFIKELMRKRREDK